MYKFIAVQPSSTMKSSAIISLVSLVLAGLTPMGAFAQRTTPEEPGTIKGTLIYPSYVLPAQQVCATQVESQKVFCTETSQNQSQYSIQVPSGAYHVYTTACSKVYTTEQTCADGYDTKRAYYNAYVECGLTYQCQQKVITNDPVSINVLAGVTQSNVNPHDWYTD